MDTDGSAGPASDTTLQSVDVSTKISEGRMIRLTCSLLEVQEREAVCAETNVAIPAGTSGKLDEDCWMHRSSRAVTSAHCSGHIQPQHVPCEVEVYKCHQPSP